MAQLFFGLPASDGFLLAGGGALLAQRLTSRPTQDLDFFTRPGIVIPDQLGPAGQAGADEVLDAAAAAWTAWRVATGIAKGLPEVPEVFSDGLTASIWY